MVTVPVARRHGIDLDGEIAALLHAVEEELSVTRAVGPLRTRRRRGWSSRLGLRRLAWRVRTTSHRDLPYVAAVALSVLIGLLIVYLTPGQ